MRGYVQVYTGNGKGKTTAALGLSLRASGAGMNVYIGQFIKNADTSEAVAINEKLPEVTIEQYGRGCFIRREPNEDDIKLAEEGLWKLHHAMLSGKYDIIIADVVRDMEDDLNLVECFCKGGTCIIIDPMLATGGSTVAAIDVLKKAGAGQIVVICIVTCAEGLSLVEEAHPDVPIYTASIDERLDDNKYIVPGLGDAGDRLFGTSH